MFDYVSHKRGLHLTAMFMYGMVFQRLWDSNDLGRTAALAFASLITLGFMALGLWLFDTFKITRKQETTNER